MKIADKIALSFLAIGLIQTSIATTVFYFVAKESIERSIYNNLATALASRSDHIETYLGMLKSSVGQLSKSVVLEDLLAMDDRQGSRWDEAFKTAMKRLVRTKDANPAIAEFLLMDRSGRIAASSSESSIGSDKSADAIFLGGQKGVYVKDVYYSEAYKEPLMAVSAPFLDSRTGELIGVLAARVNLSDLNDIVGNRTGMGDTGEVYIVNKYGYMITPSRFREGAVLKQRVNTRNFRMVRLHARAGHILSKKDTEKVFRDYRGVPVLGAHEYIPSMEWGILAEMDEREAYRSLSGIRLTALIIFCVTPVVAWLLGLFAAGLVIRPIERLRKDVEESEERFRQLFESSREAIMTLDRNGFINCNDRALELFGIKNKVDFIRKHPSELSPLKQPNGKDSMSEANIHVEKAFRAGADFFEWDHMKEDGSIFPSEVLLSRFSLQGRELLQATVRDVTERKRSEEEIRKARDVLQAKNEELKRMNQIKSDFISTVSHELRTPLSITKEGISLILDSIAGETNERQRGILTASKNNIDRLARIINELLDISRIEAGRLELKMEPVNIMAIIKEVISGFGPKIKERGLELVTDLPAGEIEIYADSDKIAQIFINLINNAVKFTDKGSIKVSVKETAGAVACSVSDTGVGISKEDLPNVFEKFRQFSRIAGPGDRGTGLGLSIVKGLIEAHKGNIWVESLPGEGTKFTFNLPKYNTESLLKEYINSSIESAKKTGSRTSLISVSVADFAEVERKTTMEGTHQVLKEVRDVIAGVLRREGDTVIKYTGEIMVLLPNCGREGALSAQKRIEGALGGYLRLKRQDLSIKLNFGCVTYPDDAEDGGGLVAKARKLALDGRNA